MSSNKTSPQNIIEYYDWVNSQKFKNSKEHHRYVPYQEESLLQNIIYPMFYHQDATFKTPLPFPLVLKESTSKKPKYVINNSYFTIVFFSHDTDDKKIGWKISICIKDHDFCDKRVNDFISWHVTYSSQHFSQMPFWSKKPFASGMDLSYKTNDELHIEFWNEESDYKLVKLMEYLKVV